MTTSPNRRAGRKVVTGAKAVPRKKRTYAQQAVIICMVADISRVEDERPRGRVGSPERIQFEEDRQRYLDRANERLAQYREETKP